MREPQVVRYNLLSIQVCVPKTFSNGEAEEFANTSHPTGIESQWQVVSGDESSPERAQCVEDHDCCHIVLQC